MFTFNPMQYAKPTQRKGAVVTDEIKKLLTEKVRSRAAEIKDEATNLKLELKNANRADLSPAGLNRFVASTTKKHKDIIQKIQALGETWADPELQWTGIAAVRGIKSIDIKLLNSFDPGNGGFGGVNVSSKGLVVITENIVIPHAGANYDLGPYKICIPIEFPDYLSLEFIPLDAPDTIFRHPHHSRQSYRGRSTWTCWGEYSTVVEDLCKTLNISGLLTLVMRFVKTYYSSSPIPHSRLEELRHAKVIRGTR